MIQKKYDRCVRKVSHKSGSKNAYAICNASMSGKTKHKGRSKGRSKSK